MEFLGIGWLELLFVFLIMLVVLGPGQLERTLRTLGTTIYRIRTSQFWQDISQARRLQQDILRESGLDQASEEVRKWNDQIKSMTVYGAPEGERSIQAPTTENLPAWTTPLPKPGQPSNQPSEQPIQTQPPAEDLPDLAAWTTPTITPPEEEA